MTIDLGALRRNVGTLRRAAGPAEVWAVVKADGYGHGAADVGRAALQAGARALCVATLGEALSLRAAIPECRLIVLGPVVEADVARAREAELELVVSTSAVPERIPVHLKLDTGMGRWGLSELTRAPAHVVGVMSHLASADCDEDFTRRQIERFLEATSAWKHVTRHLANSAGALRYPAARLDAVRCGIALYGLSPFGADPGGDGLEPVLSWTSYVAQVRLLRQGESTGYGRRFRAGAPTWVGIVPVGYGDGFRRDLTGTQVLVDGEPRPVLGSVSMDAFAVELRRELPPGAPVTLVGGGLLLEQHAVIAGTITYELACGIRSDPARARRVLVDA